jgi:hypothetical protein
MYFPKSQIKTNLYTKGNLLRYISSKEMYIGDYFETSTGQYYSGKTPQNPPIVELELIPNNSEEYFNITGKTTTNPSLSTPIIDEQADADELLRSETPSFYTLPQEYINASSINFNDDVMSPKNHTYLPTEKDYQFGAIERYFLKSINSYNFIEVNESTFTQYLNNSPLTQYTLFIPIQFSWEISGKDVDKVATTNYNTLVLKQKRLNIRGLVEFFKGKYNQFYKQFDS